MNGAKIIAIETDNPPLKCTQAQALEHVLGNKYISAKARPLYRRFLSDAGIRTRYIGMDHMGVVDDESADGANLRFQMVATRIGARAVQKCLAKAGVPAERIDGLIITTCTGYLCPGLTSYISQAVGLRRNIYALDIVGVGCAAAIPALRSAGDYLQVHPGHMIVVLSVEVCTAAISWGNEVDLILSNCIFGDGAAACLLGNSPRTNGFVLEAFESVLWPEHRNDLRFQHEKGRLRNVIGPRVPEIASKAVRELYGKLSDRQRQPFKHFAFHPGGRKILNAIQSELSLSDSAMSSSREILKNYGNMSSPSILFVLKRIMETNTLENDDSLILFSFGAGFSAFGASLKYNRPTNEIKRQRAEPKPESIYDNR